MEQSMKSFTYIKLFSLLTFVLLLGFISQGLTEDTATKVRSIPGITDADQFTKGCVSCHKNYPDMKMDARLSTVLKEWNEGVKPEVLAKFQAAAPEGVVLKGKHPWKPDANTSIPEACNKCHGKSMKTALPMTQLAHVIHLIGGKDNHFISMFQGECTHCHKLDMKTGAWSMVNAKESDVEGK